MQVVQAFDSLSLYNIRPWTFPVRNFSYQLPYFFNFKTSCMVNSSNLFSTFLNQSVSSLRHGIVSYITTKTSSLPCFWYHTFSLSSLLNNLFWFDSNKRFYLYCPVLLSYLSSFTAIATNLSNFFVNRFDTFLLYNEFSFKP